MKKVIRLFIVFLILATSSKSIGQSTFTSVKYPYSFTIPDGWKIKEKIYLPETDAKIVDGKGNSFIVSVKSLPNEFKNKSIESMLSALSDDDIKMSQSPSDFENIIITKRGTTQVGRMVFYYVFCNAPFPDGYRLNHKMFYYIYQSKIYTIDCASISFMTLDVSPYLDVMLQTIKFK